MRADLSIVSVETYRAAMPERQCIWLEARSIKAMMKAVDLQASDAPASSSKRMSLNTRLKNRARGPGGNRKKGRAGHPGRRRIPNVVAKSRMTSEED